MIHCPTNPWSVFQSVLRYHDLIWELTKRDFIGRYKGSMLGIMWSLFNPLIMLAIYTFLTSVAFKAKWGIGEENKFSFAIFLFTGMIIHSFFAECLNRAPSLIVSNVSYVKKVVFPLEILSWMVFLSASLHFVVSFFVLILFCFLAGTKVHVEVLLIPIIILPLVLVILGLTWILASLGVFLRDLSQVMGMFTTVALFLAPVLYPIDVLPDSYQSILAWNPITLPIVQLRELMFFGNSIQWTEWVISLVFGALICQSGYWWFQKSRRGFADVL